MAICNVIVMSNIGSTVVPWSLQPVPQVWEDCIELPFRKRNMGTHWPLCSAFANAYRKLTGWKHGAAWTNGRSI